MFLGSPNGSFKLEPYRSPPQCIIQVVPLPRMLLHGGRFLLIFFLLQPTEARNPARRYTALWPKNARNGSIALHHDQYPATVSFNTASTTERKPNTQNPMA